MMQFSHEWKLNEQTNTATCPHCGNTKDALDIADGYDRCPMSITLSAENLQRVINELFPLSPTLLPSENKKNDEKVS